MAKNTSYPPIKDGVKADNSTYSSNQIDRMISEVEGSIPDLPEPEVANIGEVIGIVSDGSTGAKYGTISIENELPEPSISNNGKFAKVVSTGDDTYEWGTATVKDYAAYPLMVTDYGTPSVSSMTAAQFEDHITKGDRIVCTYLGNDLPNYQSVNIEANNINAAEKTITFIGYWSDANNDPYGVFIQVHSNGSALSVTKKKFEMIQALEDITGELTDGIYIATDGTVQTDANWSATDYIEVDEGETIAIVSTGTSPYNCFYDSSKAPILPTPSGLPSTVPSGYNEYTIPSGVKYYRYSDTTTNMQRVRIYKVNT